jgi:hypothetical protein
MARVIRTDGAIAVYSTGNLEGSWYFFRGMPDTVITYLNGLCYKEQRPHHREPLFAFGSGLNDVIEECVEE